MDESAAIVSGSHQSKSASCCVVINSTTTVGLAAIYCAPSVACMDRYGHTEARDTDKQHLQTDEPTDQPTDTQTD